MKMDDIVKLLANKINQPHVIETYLKKIAKGAYEQGKKDMIEELKIIDLASIRQLFEPVELDADFTEALNKYCKEEGTNKPTKKRF